MAVLKSLVLYIDICIFGRQTFDDYDEILRQTSCKPCAQSDLILVNRKAKFGPFLLEGGGRTRWREHELRLPVFKDFETKKQRNMCKSSSSFDRYMCDICASVLWKKRKRNES